MEELFEAGGVVDRVAGAGAPMVARLGDDILPHANRSSTPFTCEVTVRVFQTREQAGSHGVDVSGGHARDVRTSAIHRL